MKNDNIKLKKSQLRYQGYLQSPHWIRLKVITYKKSRSCSICHSSKNLNIHHLTYDNRGKERPEDLIVLCNDCHTKAHNLYSMTRAVEWSKNNKLIPGNQDAFSHMVSLYGKAMKTQNFQPVVEALRFVNVDNLIGTKRKHYEAVYTKSMNKINKRNRSGNISGS